MGQEGIHAQYEQANPSEHADAVQQNLAARRSISANPLPLACCTSRADLPGSQEALNTDEDQGQCAHDDVRPPRAQHAVELNQGLGDAENQDAKQRPEDVAGTAAQHRPAHDHGGNHRQLKAGRIQAMAGSHVDIEGDARQRRAKSRQSYRPAPWWNSPANPSGGPTAHCRRWHRSCGRSACSVRCRSPSASTTSATTTSSEM